MSCTDQTRNRQEKFHLRLWMVNSHQSHRRHLYTLSQVIARECKAALGRTFKLVTWNTRALKALAHWLQKIRIPNSYTLIRSWKLLLYGCCFNRRYCPGRPWWGVQLHSLQLENIFQKRGKSQRTQLLSTTFFWHPSDLELGNTQRETLVSTL